MADKTKIEWTDATWNPVRGCSLVSAACKNCYAMHVAARFNGEGLPYEGLTVKTSQGPKWSGKIMLVNDALSQPLYWARPRMIFVNSMSDLFHDDVPEWYIDRVFAVMALAHQHTFQVLTKRPERMLAYCRAFSWERVVENCRGEDGVSVIHKHSVHAMMNHFRLVSGDSNGYADRSAYPLPNVWMGVSIEDQPSADARIPLLLCTPAAVHFLSGEPLLGPVELPEVFLKRLHFDGKDHGYPDGAGMINWVIVGGESGRGARPMHPDWVRSLRDQCAAAGVPFLFKQWGEHSLAYDRDRDDPDWRRCAEMDRRPGRWINLAGGHGFHGERVHYAERVGKKAAGRLLDGVQHDGFPREMEA